MSAPGPRGWRPAAFVDHVRDVLGELNRRHDRRLTLRAPLDVPMDWTAADSAVVPRVAWRSPHGTPAEALGCAAQCPLTFVRWQDDAPHPDDLTTLHAWLANHALLAEALLTCAFPEPNAQGIGVPIALWLPRLWLTAQHDGQVEIQLILLGEDDPDSVLRETSALLDALQAPIATQESLNAATEPSDLDVAAIAGLVDAMRAGQAQKVVWSRTLGLAGAWSRSTLVNRMRGHRPEAWVVDVQLAGSQNALCASPELLVHCAGDSLTTMALAGTGTAAQLHAHDARLDDEHGRVRDFVRDRLANLGVADLQLRADLSHAGPLTHRRTHMTGRRTREIDALRVALTLHPTPALLGLPRNAAVTLIDANESPRGLYGGCLARLACDGSGDGEAVVLLRGGSEVAGQWLLRAGAGLVPQSVPADEANEVANKLAAIVASVAPEGA